MFDKHQEQYYPDEESRISCSECGEVSEIMYENKNNSEYYCYYCASDWVCNELSLEQIIEIMFDEFDNE